jgi:hypothetical protein
MILLECFVNFNRVIAELWEEIQIKGFFTLSEHQSEMHICEMSHFWNRMVNTRMWRIRYASRTWRKYFGKMIAMYVNTMFPIQQLKKECKSKVDVYDRKVETISGM